jgi:hypothetical protein
MFVYNDGGRAKAGFKGETRDCVTRAIAIATGKPYKTVYDALNKLAGKSVARTGVPRKIYEAYLLADGWRWVPTMLVGKGCKVHLLADELPKGKLIVRVSKHIVAVIDGVIHDTSDPSRGGSRCVYGYFTKEK